MNNSPPPIDRVLAIVESRDAGDVLTVDAIAACLIVDQHLVSDAMATLVDVGLLSVVDDGYRVASVPREARR